MTEFAQTLVDGLANGAIYASLALALVLIYRATNIVNFAQGEMAMFSTYVAWQLTAWGVPLAVTVLVTLAAALFTGAAVERVLIRPLEGTSELAVVILTIGLFLTLNAVAVWVWGGLIKTVPSVLPDATWDVGGVRLSGTSVGIVAVLVIEVVVLYGLFQFTKLGLAMRAVAESGENASLTGVDVRRILVVGWGFAAVLGAIAGLLIAPQVFLEPNFMFGVLIYSFAAAVLGGIDSPGGAVVGGLIVGVTENLAGNYVGAIGSDLKILVPLTLIVGILLVRPNGLFGTKAVTRV
ncbi:branched-chain amino acid ABC transporter permease [Patulibacter defluvii]|uniref:branched-chain amino acid ABC transporter permease n=1 Tax=Patulibacter defluvii TaxID=3095358 RepID=UPI002A748D0F|nr:branched-chain amino acid ABC transporter permease [Patulibacter sp. DM4]